MNNFNKYSITRHSDAPTHTDLLKGKKHSHNCNNCQHFEKRKRKKGGYDCYCSLSRHYIDIMESFQISCSQFKKKEIEEVNKEVDSNDTSGT